MHKQRPILLLTGGGMTMTIEAFCKKTGWPVEEFRELPWSKAEEVLALYGLEFLFTCSTRLAARGVTATSVPAE